MTFNIYNFETKSSFLVDGTFVTFFFFSLFDLFLSIYSLPNAVVESLFRLIENNFSGVCL